VGADPARIIRTPPVLGAEDFAWISREVPACYFFLGTGDPTQEVGASWHSPRFRMNESVLPQAAAAFAHLALA
jgi:metal-dependent amidase/aminoacylase/carboxypeptidase family protein